LEFFSLNNEPYESTRQTAMPGPENNEAIETRNKTCARHASDLSFVTEL
jgi:hypothetical protein